MTPVRGIRGAIRADENNRESVQSATRELVEAMMKANDLKLTDIVSAFFTATPDLNADFPAYATRELGWKHVPMLCAQEINVPGAMTRVIRILFHVNNGSTPEEIKHVYLGDTKTLRPDLAEGEKDDRRNES
ncbi:MAG: chorismate mutase [candidate division Zixibacteria bacterium]|nr:chorismate mutase [candidate division Zixibacteria bacterium]MDH3936123.1 chorismate mutase [candidate division Zixibacteria bacterium]MDH4032632.1 chorismate mutase [candidate division Zixibacteria bacterium]